MTRRTQPQLSHVAPRPRTARRKPWHRRRRRAATAGTHRPVTRAASASAGADRSAYVTSERLPFRQGGRRWRPFASAFESPRSPDDRSRWRQLTAAAEFAADDDGPGARREGVIGAGALAVAASNAASASRCRDGAAGATAAADDNPPIGTTERRFEGTYAAPLALPRAAALDGALELPRGAAIWFSIALERDNCGALVRRTFPFRRANQRARVLLDGGGRGGTRGLEWFSPGFNRHGWDVAQADLELPFELTHGRARVNVTLIALSEVFVVGHIAVFSVVC